MEQTLSLQSFGARLRVKDGLFVVTVPDLTGAGNHREEEIAAPTLETLLLYRHTSVSSDALLLAQEHGASVFLMGDDDLPVAFLAGALPASSNAIWRQQLLFQGTTRGLEFARGWLCTKVRRKIEWLSKLRSYRTGDALQRLEAGLAALRDTLARLSTQSLHNVREAAAALRGLEGQGQRLYLDLMASLLPGASKFDGRSRQPADDLFNAMLNYAYGILYRLVEKALWEAGLNPYFGFLHTDERNQKALLYDFIEPFRPWMDKIVFSLCARKEANTQQHTRVLPNGGIWLNAAGKQLLTEAVHRHFSGAMVAVGQRFWRLRHAALQEARRFASALRGERDAWPAALPALAEA